MHSTFNLEVRRSDNGSPYELIATGRWPDDRSTLAMTVPREVLDELAKVIDTSSDANGTYSIAHSTSHYQVAFFSSPPEN
jgi:hypothetical protein